MLKIKNRKPLTPEEKRFFFEWSLCPKSSAYNINLQFELKGRLKVSILKKAFYELINKYEILRSIFHVNSKAEERIILNNYTVDLNIINLSKQTKSKNSLLLDFFFQPFFLTTTPPSRYILIKIKKEHYILALSWHHIIVDAFAVQILLKDLAIFYNNYSNKCNNTFFSSSNSISQDALKPSKEQSVNSTSYEQILNYWYNKLINKPNYINIKEFTDTNKIGKRYCCILSHKLSQKLMHLIGITRSTLFTTLAAIFNILFFYYANQKQIILGYAVSNRDIHSQDLVGCFVNILPIATEISNNDTYIELLECIRLCMVENTKNKQISLLNIIKMLREKNVDFNKLPFNVQLNQTTSISFSLNLQKIRSKIVHIKKFEMQPENNLTIRFDYFTKKILIEFESACSDSLIKFIQQFIKSLKIIIKTLVLTPNIRIKDIPVITQKDKRKLLEEWNQTDKEYTSDKTIHKRFEEQVEKTPNNTAIVYKEISLTYKELNEKANRLANYLMQSYNITPETLIILCLDRNENTLVAILAVLKIGGAYVPIDPNYPAERIKYIIEDTRAILVLTNEIYKQKLKEISNNQIHLDSLINATDTANSIDIRLNKCTEVLSIDSKTLQKKLKNQLINNQKTTTTKFSVAYVIYTSGTTGNPKGVIIEHASYISLIDCIKNLYFKDKYKISTYSITNYVFDIFGLEYGLPLLNGGTISIGTNKFSSLDCSSYDFIQMTPSLCELKLDSLINTSNIKLLIGGENLSHDLLIKILSKSMDVINVYGPTETTIWSTSKFYPYKEDCSTSYVSIGNPLDNEKVYILDSNLTLLPIGVVGELYIGGIGLARGYLNSSDLTAESFIFNPFQTREERKEGKNTRLYKTGDLVRWLPNGNLEYIGRNDFQVKIRGYRIELAEIENALSNYKGIRQNVVLARQHTQGNKYLIGYYIANNKLDEKAIINYLKLKLPEYMIPSVLIYLEKLPLTINGKLDRKSLPEPKIIGNSVYIPPRNTVEKQLAKIWIKLLKIKQVGIYDNFFSLGGDSLLAIRMVMMAQKKNINLEMHELYNANDLSSLSMIITEKEVNENLLVTKINKNTKVPVSFFQQEVWPILKVNPQIFNIPFVINLHGNLNIQALERSLNILLQCHSSLRTTFIEESGIVYQVINKYKITPLKVIYDCTDNTSLDLFIKKYVNKKFNLKKDLPIRFLLIKKDIKTYLFILVLHHMVIDGWSIDIIIRDLCKNYNQYLKIERSHIIKIHENSQYNNFSIKQVAQVQPLLSRISVEEFKKIFGTLDNNILHLPKLNNSAIDKILTPKSFIKIVIKLDVSIIKQFSVKQNTTIGTVILALFKCILYNLTKQKNIAINFPVTTRPTYKEQNTVGYFVNMFIINTQFYKNITFKEIFEQIKNRIEFIKKYQNLPFKYLVDQFNIGKKVSTKCNTMFVNQNINTEMFNFKNLNISTLNYEPTKISHDILAELFEEDNELTLIFTLRKHLSNTPIITLINNIFNSTQKVINNIDIQIKDL